MPSPLRVPHGGPRTSAAHPSPTSRPRSSSDATGRQGQRQAAASAAETSDPAKRVPVRPPPGQRPSSATRASSTAFGGDSAGYGRAWVAYPHHQDPGARKGDNAPMMSSKTNPRARLGQAEGRGQQAETPPSGPPRTKARRTEGPADVQEAPVEDAVEPFAEARPPPPSPVTRRSRTRSIVVAAPAAPRSGTRRLPDPRTPRARRVTTALSAEGCGGRHRG